MLGSSPQSAIWAGELGLPYAFADFINPRGAEIAQLYRDRIPALRTPGRAPHDRRRVGRRGRRRTRRPSVWRRAAGCRCALLRQGRLVAVPPPDKALRFLESHGDGAGDPGRRAVVGTPQAVRAGLEEVADEYAVEEVIVVTITFDHEARRRSYELIADAFALAGTPAAATST